MRIVSLLGFIISLSCICSFCFADVSYPHVFPRLVSNGEDVMALVFIRVDNAATPSCDLSKTYSFSYEYNYSYSRKTGVLTERPYIYPNPNNKLKLYSANFPAYNNSNLSILIECDDVSEPDTHHTEIKTYKVMTGDLQFPYAEDEFVFRNKPNETIILYPYEIIEKKGKELSEGEIQTYEINYSLYNLYTENVIERKAFQKQLDLYYPSQNNLFTYEARYPIGYIVFEGDNGTVLGGKYFPYYTIPFSFSLIETGGVWVKGQTTTLGIDYQIHYDSFPDSVSVEITKPDNKKDIFSLEKSSNYQKNYLLNQTGTYDMTATADSDTGYSKTSNIQVNVQDYKTVVLSTDKETYYLDETIHLNATLFEKTTPKPSYEAFLEIKSGNDIYYNTTDAKKTNNIWLFSIPVSFEPGPFPLHDLFIHMKDEDGVLWTGEKQIFLYDQVPVNFTISPETVNVIFKGDKIKKIINFTNTGSTNISSIIINTSGIEDSVSFDASSFSLDVLQSKNISVYIKPENLSKEKIEGDIFFTAGDISRKLGIEIDMDVSYSAELETNKYTIEAIVGKDTTISLKLKNTGVLELDEITFLVSGQLTGHLVNSSVSDSILPGMEETLFFDFSNFDEEKTISGNIEIDTNGVKNTAEITIIVIGDIVDDINEIKGKKDRLVDRLDGLKSSEKENLMEKFNELQGDISELNSDYSNGKYLDAKGKIALINDKIYYLEMSISNIENSEDSTSDDSYCGDGICNADEDEVICVEDCSSGSDSNGEVDKPLPKKTTWIIVVGVLIAVVAVVIVATSIVPEDYQDDEEEGEIDYDKPDE